MGRNSKMNSTQSLIRLTAILSSIKKKTAELETRKKLVQEMEQSDIVLQKQQAKEEKLERQIQSHRDELKRKRDYYENELKMNEDKYEREIQKLRNQYENYRDYCHRKMNESESTIEKTIEKLEAEKDKKTLFLSDDKILKRLEIELKQLEDEHTEVFSKYSEQQQQEHTNRIKEHQEDEARREYQQRMHEQWKREQYLQELEIKKAQEEREAEEKRQKVRFEIEAIMKRENCSFEVAKDMYQYNISKQGAIFSKEKQRDDMQEQSKKIRLAYPQYKFIVSELDKEYTEKMIKLEGDALVSFFESLKPLVELKLKCEADDTLLDDKHQEMYDTLTFDQKIECWKLKSKEKRYKFIEKNKRSRVQQINDRLGCV